MGDDAMFESILQLSEIIGLPVQWGGQKTYLFGQLLVGDEFQVWGKTITPWNVSGRPDDTMPRWPPIRSISQVYFYAIVVMAGSILVWLTKSCSVSTS